MGIVRDFVSDERGQDLVEYALLSGIIGTAGVALFPAILESMSNAYQSWQTEVDGIWEPCPPAPSACS